jgi:hypothetical protein
MKMWPLGIALVLALMFGSVVAPVAAKEQTADYTVDVTGAVPSFVGDPGIFIGTFRMTGFVAQDSTLLVQALLDGTISDGDRSTIGNLRREFAFPVAYVAGGCGSVSVTLQPLGPDVSPYHIILDPVLLEDRGQTKKIDKLLCRVGDLVEDGADVQAMAKALNRVLGELGK